MLKNKMNYLKKVVGVATVLTFGMSFVCGTLEAKPNNNRMPQPPAMHMPQMPSMLGMQQGGHSQRNNQRPSRNNNRNDYGNHQNDNSRDSHNVNSPNRASQDNRENDVRNEVRNNNQGATGNNNNIGRRDNVGKITQGDNHNVNDDPRKNTPNNSRNNNGKRPAEINKHNEERNKTYDEMSHSAADIESYYQADRRGNVMEYNRESTVDDRRISSTDDSKKSDSNVVYSRGGDNRDRNGNGNNGNSNNNAPVINVVVQNEIPINNNIQSNTEVNVEANNDNNIVSENTNNNSNDNNNSSESNADASAESKADSKAEATADSESNSTSGSESNNSLTFDYPKPGYVPMPKEDPIDIGSSNKDNNIPDDAYQYNGHSYKLFDVGYTWYEAEQYCKDHGGHLLIIESQGEQNFIADLVQSEGRRNNYWLGGFRKNGDFEWIDGSPLRYSNWANAQPDNFKGTEDALMLYRGRNPINPNEFATWNDLTPDGTCYGEDFFGTHNFGFICEWDHINSNIKPNVLQPSSQQSKMLWGDVNKDGIVDDTDLQIVVDVQIDLMSPDAYDKDLLDVNGDGEIDILDTTALKFLIIGKYTQEDIERIRRENAEKKKTKEEEGLKLQVVELHNFGCTGLAKPVIYLYPQVKTSVNVNLTLDGEITCTYPKINDGWNVVADPNGTLTDNNGKHYNYLFWEGVTDKPMNFSQGFCVAGSDVEEFLQEKLSYMGLNEKEINDFMVYWLPQMQDNPYNVIAFQTKNYVENAVLDVTPEPDTMIRVFMAWKKSDEKVDIKEQQLENIQRKGFTLVEWGGGEVIDGHNDTKLQ